ncbi:hypothetical protein WA026_014561 [Henosepilachna vigintioctopunctata]|uniref:Phorbol-ester/DAG-type domain-containing protein n=1 Tax=Henosepilachna vigintioctopunctata TaxID=420089 RepID=A0AAW1V7N6_9CUCU
MEQPEEHSPFKSLSRLWENPPHLAVFTNYVLSNADPNSLLFYLLTDLYKEGNAKEMRKWAFEIHSTFLVPGAPLRLGNVDENVAREIDDVLLREYAREEKLRKIFWKARARAKEELGRQLADFQQKRTAGLGTIYGPCDTALAELSHDKNKELKLYETLFLEKLEPFLEELDKENYDPKKFYTAAALTTVLSRIFGLRSAIPNLERCPTFVNKEKSFKSKFLGGRYTRKQNIQGHQFTAQQYYTVILCNNCHQIIYGIGPQGYQCNVCNINLHRQCIKLYDDSCPGPINKKDRGIGKFIRIRPHEPDHRRKGSTNTFIQMERDRRQAEEKDAEVNDNVDELKFELISYSCFLQCYIYISFLTCRSLNKLMEEVECCLPLSYLNGLISIKKDVDYKQRSAAIDFDIVNWVTYNLIAPCAHLILKVTSLDPLVGIDVCVPFCCVSYSRGD